MKVALFKLGFGIDINPGYNALNFEVLGTITILKRAGLEVDCFTDSKHAERNATEHNVYSYQYFLDNKEKYDKVVVVNGTLHISNNPEATSALDILNCFDSWGKPLIYFVYDPDLIKLDTSIIPLDSEYETELANDVNSILNLKNPIDYITLCKNTEHLSKFTLNTRSVQYLPLERFGTLLYRDCFTIKRKKCDYDLTYFGSFKVGRRKDLMEKYFFDLPEDISLGVTGRISIEDFPEMEGKTPPTFLPPIPYEDVMKESQKGWATFLITDKFYRDTDDIPPRIYECAQYGQIVFVDTDCDRTRRVYQRDENKWLYISSKEELVEKIRFIKSLPEDQYKEILDNQNKELLKFDEDQFYKDLNSFVNTLGE